MNYKRLLPLLPALCAAFIAQAQTTVASCLDCRLPDSHNAKEKVILEEAYSLDSAFLKRVPVYISDDRTEATENQEILISKKSISEITQNDEKLERLVLRIILSHERAHLLQYQLFPSAVRKDNRELMLQMECQADIFAGAYVCTEFLNRSGDKLNNFTKYVDTSNISIAKVKKIYQSENDYLADAFKIFVDLGKYEHTVHPMSQQRLIAAKLGYSMGSFKQANRLKKFYMLLMEGQPGTEEQKIQAFNQISSQSLDIRYGDDDWKWGFRQAARITHPNPIPMRYLQIEQSSIHWDTSFEHRLVYYEFVIKNTAPFSILCDFAVSCNSVERDDPRKLELTSTVSAKNSWMTLAPGRSYKITDSLTWYATKTQMPSLSLIPDVTSFYVVDFANPAEKQQFSHEYLINPDVQQSDLINQLGLLLDLVSRNKRKGFKDLKASPSLLDQDSTTSFTCFSPSSGVTATIPIKGSGHLSFNLFDGSRAEALKAYDQAIEAIKSHYGANLSRISKGDYSDRRQSIFFYIKDPETNRTSLMNLVAKLRDSRSEVNLEDHP